MKGIKGIVNFTRQECRECEYEADSPHCGKCQVKAIESKIKEARAEAFKEVGEWVKSKKLPPLDIDFGFPELKPKDWKILYESLLKGELPK